MLSAAFFMILIPAFHLLKVSRGMSFYFDNCFDTFFTSVYC